MAADRRHLLGNGTTISAASGKKIGLKKKDRRVRTELDGYIVTPLWPQGNY